jgi:hypothetical protein
VRRWEAEPQQRIGVSVAGCSFGTRAEELLCTNLIDNFSRKAGDVVAQPVVRLLLMMLLLQLRLLAIMIISPPPTIVRCHVC